MNLLIALVLGYFGWKHFFPKAVTLTAGNASLAAGVPYGIDLRQPFVTGSTDLRSPTAQAALTKSLLAQGAENVTYRSDATGVLVHYLLTPTSAQTMGIGKLAYGGATVIAVSRLDGKPF